MKIDIKDYNYPLPETSIALHPLHRRDDSRLLVYNKGEILHQKFDKIGNFLPERALLVRNDTKVVQARLIFQRSSGGLIEVFCLKPLRPFAEMSQAMQQKGSCTWLCLAKKLKKWALGETLQLKISDKEYLEATLLTKDGKEVEVEFRWPGEISWAGILDRAGEVPLPPYLHRPAEPEDKADYQTVYARAEGAVAAPTAGLHFTDSLIEALESKGIEFENVTLHVSVGTFVPVEAENALEHPMHEEQLIIDKSVIIKLAETERPIVAIGTTSMRTLESLYWFGAAVLENPAKEKFFVVKMEPYSAKNQMPDRKQAMKAVLAWMEHRCLDTLYGSTEIFIFPGYTFRMVNGLITNFHQPQSTLLLLVSAFIGEDWHKVYNNALEKGYRFLSYGDSSLLLPG